MTVYILCFDPAYSVISSSGRVQTAKHYIGFTTDRDPSRRIAQHLAGKGNPLVKAVLDRGGKVNHVKTWRSGTRKFERYLKDRADINHWCPCCGKGRKLPTIAAFKRLDYVSRFNRKRNQSNIRREPRNEASCPPWRIDYREKMRERALVFFSLVP